MIGSTRNLRVFAYAKPADMRKQYEGLSALVRQELGRNPESGDLFLFQNKRRNRAKVLHYDGTGLCVYAKRLDKGSFAPLWRDSISKELPLTMTELQLFLEGNELVGRMRFSPPKVTEKDLVIAPPQW